MSRSIRTISDPMPMTSTEPMAVLHENEGSIEPEVAEPDPEFPPHLMTIDRYKRLVESGVYDPKEPVFLWKGRLVEQMTKGDPHAFSCSIAVDLLVRLVPEGWCVRGDQPIVLSNNSVPEPDVAILRGRFRDYVKRTPTAGEVALVIEVSDSSLRMDTRSVLKAYASNQIPIYWIVNIPDGRVEVYSHPTGPAQQPSYREKREYGPDDEIPVILDGLEVGRIAAKEILP